MFQPFAFHVFAINLGDLGNSKSSNIERSALKPGSVHPSNVDVNWHGHNILWVIHSSQWFTGYFVQLLLGVYDVVNNLGSLVARFVFLPIEESFYIFFVKVLRRGADVAEQNQEDLQLVAKVLGSLLKIVQFIGLTILCFGFSYSHLALHLYGGNALSQGIGSTLMRCYSAYVLLLAINGISECFVFAVMKQQELQRYNMYLVAFSCIFLILSVLLTQALGSVGFIMANCLNMALRIAVSLSSIHRFFAHSSHRPLQRLWLSPCMATSFVAAWAFTSLSEMYMYTGAGVQGTVLHLAVGAGCLMLLLIAMNKSEPELLIIAKRHLLPGQRRKSE